MFKATKGKEVTMGQVSGSTEVLLFRLQLMGSMGKISAFGTFSKGCWEFHGDIMASQFQETEISWGFMFFLAIKEILDVVNVAFFRYGQQLNVQEMDLYQNLDWKNVEDGTLYKKGKTFREKAHSINKRSLLNNTKSREWVDGYDDERKSSKGGRGTFNPRIIDSGTLNHMIGLSYIFSTYTSCSRHQKVKIADGSLSYVVGKGLTVLGRWKAYLYCNLISISKLTHDLNYCSKFSPTHCVFQNLCSGKRIKSAREMEGLFVLVKRLRRFQRHYNVKVLSVVKLCCGILD
ncbi:hypothetical protein CK203_021021 [Vitis vinifera]|uniref:Retrovirus-related Pol polyprotein from transposon TNT 1-94-like beta-barrel domain-containing protein n=1 Tax=Vitis vinifera TaxID=29760 RepID=A0A438JX18_VITVI|nr:hypothetical protein CK203_021021 [Vitis vinifera]